MMGGYDGGVYQGERVTDWWCILISYTSSCIKCIGGIWVGFPSKMDLAISRYEILSMA